MSDGIAIIASDGYLKQVLFAPRPMLEGLSLSVEE